MDWSYLILMFLVEVSYVVSIRWWSDFKESGVLMGDVQFGWGKYLEVIVGSQFATKRDCQCKHLSVASPCGLSILHHRGWIPKGNIPKQMLQEQNLQGLSSNLGLDFTQHHFHSILLVKKQKSRPASIKGENTMQESTYKMHALDSNL